MADMTRSGEPHDADGDRGRPFSELRDSGLLWLINRAVLHPRGFALALHMTEGGDATGWRLIGDGSEPWGFLMDEEEEACFRRLEAFLNSHRTHLEDGDG